MIDFNFFLDKVHPWNLRRGTRSRYRRSHRVVVQLRETGRVGGSPLLVINGNTNLESHRALFNLNAFCSWRHAASSLPSLPSCDPSNPSLSLSAPSSRYDECCTPCKSLVARSLLCFYSRWMSQSARLCIRGEHALPQWEPLERALVAGRGGEENGSSCAIPLRGVGPSINFPLITSPCPHVVALLKSLLSRAPKLFNCVARYLLSFLLPSSFLSLVRRFREERALLIVGSSFFPGRGHRRGDRRGGWKVLTNRRG